MLVTASRLVIWLAASSLCVFAVWGVSAPHNAIGWVKRTMDADWGIWFAVGIRLLLGMALIVSAPFSRFPITFQFVGWIAIIAAVSAVFIGRRRLQRFTDWWIARFSSLGIRLWVLLRWHSVSF